MTAPSDPSGALDPDSGDRLDSWKEIAAFLKRDVRTVQRWEKLAGLPVHRHSASRLRTAYAYRSELEAWWRQQRPEVVSDLESPTDQPEAAADSHGVTSTEPQATLPVEQQEEVPAAPGRSSRLVPGLVAVLGVIVGLSAALVLWQRRDAPEGPVAAGTPIPVLVLPFEDHSGNARLAAELYESVSSEMARLPTVELVAPGAIQATLRLMRRNPAEQLTMPVAREVAIRDGRVRFLISGRLHALASGYGADLHAVDPADGRAIAALDWQAETAPRLRAAARTQSRRFADRLRELPPHVQTVEPLEPVTSAVLAAVRLYSAATQAGARGQWGASEMLARRATAADEEMAAAYAWTGWAMRHQGRPVKQCLPLLERAIALSESTSDREIYMVNAMYRVLSGDLGGAAAALEALLRLHPRERHALELLSDVSFRLGRASRALQLAVLRAEQYPRDFEANVRAAQVLTSAGRDRARAEGFVKRALALATPDTLRTRPMMHAWLSGFPVFHEWSDGRDAKAAELLESLERGMSQKIGTERDALSTTIGFGNMALGRYAAAERAFRAGASPVRQMNLAMLALTRGDEDEARQLLRQVAQHSALRPSLFARVGLEADALRGLEHAMPSPHAEGLEAVSRGLIEARRGRLESAATALRRGMELLRWSGEPEYFFAIEELARIAESQGDRERAAALLAGAVDSRSHTYGARQWTAAYWARLKANVARRQKADARFASAPAESADVPVVAGKR